MRQLLLRYIYGFYQACAYLASHMDDYIVKCSGINQPPTSTIGNGSGSRFSNWFCVTTAVPRTPILDRKGT